MKFDFDERIGNDSRAWCSNCEWRVWGGLSHVHAKAHFEETDGEHLVTVITRDGERPEEVHVCGYCGIEVVSDPSGAVWLPLEVGQKYGTAEALYCQPENLPGGVKDTRIFPLHGRVHEGPPAVLS